MTTNLDQLRDRLLIDKNDLDMELTQQAELADHAGRGHAQAVHIRDLYYRTMKEEQGRAYFRCRQHLLESGEKATETAVAGLLESDSAYKEARAEYILLGKEVSEWESLRDAFRQRSFMIRNLVDLFLSNHYTKTSVAEPGPTGTSRSALEGRRRPKLGESDD